MTSFSLLTPPSVEPVLLADAKQQARIDTNADDAFVISLITAARQWAERYTGRAFVTQTWQMALDAWPGVLDMDWDGVRQGPISSPASMSYISLPRPPLQSVTSVTYYDNNDNGAVWSAGSYFVDTVREPGRLALRLGSVWPVPTRLTNGIIIQYVAGYGNDGSAVPEAIKTAIRQLVAHWYEHRGEAAISPSARGAVILPNVPVPFVIQTILDAYRVRYSGV